VIDPPVADTVLPADMSIAPETVLDDNEVKDIDGKLISLALAVEPVCNVILPASALKDVPVERSIAPDPNSLAALLAVKDPEEIPEPVVIETSPPSSVPEFPPVRVIEPAPPASEMPAWANKEPPTLTDSAI
jgi:hypothetical protein